MQVASWSTFEWSIADLQRGISSGARHLKVRLMELDGRTQSRAAAVIIDEMPGAGPGLD